MKKKTIFIDGLGLVDGHFSGVGQYILGILQGMDQYIELAKYNGAEVFDVRVIIPRDKVMAFKKFSFKHVGYKTFPLPFRHMAALWHRGKLPPIDLWCGRGHYIFPRFADMPLAFSKSEALVIFDLSFELHRQYSDEGNAKFLSNSVRRSVAKAKKIIAISNNARQELIDFYKLAPSDVVLSTPATNPQIIYRRSQIEIDAVKATYNISGEYILALSNLEPRKNLDMLVDAYCSLPKEYRKNLKLLLVGVSGWKTDKLFEKIISKVEAGFEIIRPSKYVAEKDKAAIISGAKMLIYPSHYEGFGMPPLEALACGTPVITTDNSSLPQAVGDAAKIVKSNDLPDLIEAIVEYLDNYEAVAKEALIKGPAHAAKFSWVESAKVFFEVIENANK